MRNLDLNISAREKLPTRTTRRSKLFTTIIDAIEDKKATHIVSLDLKKIHEAVADFFIICSVSSSVQAKAVIDSIEDKVKDECGERPYGRGGDPKEGWMIIDYVNVVVHVFNEEKRIYYNLEELWADAQKKEHK